MRIKSISLALAFGMIVCGSSVRAESTKGKFGVGGFAGAAIPTGDRTVKDNGKTDLGLEGFVRYGITDHWSAAVAYDNLHFKNDLRVEPVTLSGIYSFFPEKRWTPFLQGGLGAAAGIGSKTWNDLGARAGLGLDYFVIPDLSLSAVVHYFYTSKIGASTNESHSIVPGAALTYYFGCCSECKNKKKAQPAPAAKTAAAPAAVDSDGDGVIDSKDQCPDSPKGSMVDANGCPKDSDRDGVADDKDQCPDSPKGSIVDAKGCPKDSDGDGVTDDEDKCPDTPKGTPVNDKGCPKLKASEKVSIELKVLFDTAKADVKPEYDAEIKRVAEFMANYPETSAEIEGHTDNVGSEAGNVSLSQRRADSVRQYLISKYKVDAKRLTAKGYGPKQPLASNDTPEGRTKNRRVVATLSATKQ